MLRRFLLFRLLDFASSCVFVSHGRQLATSPLGKARGCRIRLKALPEPPRSSCGPASGRQANFFETLSPELTLRLCHCCTLKSAVETPQALPLGDPVVPGNCTIEEVNLTRRGVWRSLGLLAMQWARRCFACSRHQLGRIVPGDREAPNSGGPGQASFSRVGWAHTGRWRGPARRARQRNGAEISVGERKGSAAVGRLDQQAAPSIAFPSSSQGAAPKPFFGRLSQSSAAMPAASCERRTGTNSKSTRSCQFAAHCSKSFGFSQSIN